jgi:hypothetical protein
VHDEVDNDNEHAKRHQRLAEAHQTPMALPSCQGVWLPGRRLVGHGVITF